MRPDGRARPAFALFPISEGVDGKPMCGKHGLRGARIMPDRLYSNVFQRADRVMLCTLSVDLSAVPFIYSTASRGLSKMRFSFLTGVSQ